jgi:hypothetical protein
MNKHIFLAVLVAAAFLASPPRLRSQDCNFPPKALAQGEHREYSGLYENQTYGYSVVLPADLIGYDTANPLYQHGFGIIFGTEPKSYIFVIGGPNSIEFTNPTDAAIRHVKYLRDRGNVVKSSMSAHSTLGTLKAGSLVATYSCSGTADRYVIASVVALSPDRSMLYEITLYARADHFKRDRTVLDALVKSWKYLGVSVAAPD